MPNRASILKQQFLQSVALPWKELLPDSTVKELLAKENLRYYNSVYTPIVTLATSEIVMSRLLYANLVPSDVILADRACAAIMSI